MRSAALGQLTVLLGALLGALLGVAACGGGGEAPAGGGARPPDVVLIVLDTLRADALSFYGNERETAPYLAELAQGATVFARAYSTSTWTAPATASLHTGVYPHRHGVLQGFLAHFKDVEGGVPEERLPSMELYTLTTALPTLAQRFKDLGYGTWGLASNVNIGPEMSFDRGFDHFERHDLEPARFLRERLMAWRDAMQRDGRPRFLYLHFNDVHWPYELRPRFYTEDPERDETAEYRARYESELGYLDGFLARIHRDLGFDDRTLLVVVADHGEEFGDHGRLNHELSLFNELNQVPFLIHAPRLRVRPGVVRENVSLVDVAPTMLDLLGFPVPEDLDGRSLAAFCASEDKRTGLADASRELEERPLFLHRVEHEDELWGVILGDWKLIVSSEGIALFQLVDDPREQTNVATEHADVAQRLMGLLDEHRARAAAEGQVRRDMEVPEELLERLKALGYVK